MTRPKKAASHVLATFAMLGWSLENIQDIFIPEEHNTKSGVLRGFRDLSHSISDFEYLFDWREMRKDKFFKDGVDPFLPFKKALPNTLDCVLIGWPLWDYVLKSTIRIPLLIPHPYLQATVFMRIGWDFLYVFKASASRAAEVAESYDAAKARKLRKIEKKFERWGNGLKTATQAFDYFNHREIVDWWNNRDKRKAERLHEEETEDKLGKMQTLKMYKDMFFDKHICWGEVKLWGGFFYKFYDNWRTLYRKEREEGLRSVIRKEYKKKQENIYNGLVRLRKEDVYAMLREIGHKASQVSRTVVQKSKL